MKFEERAFCPVARRDTRLQMRRRMIDTLFLEGEKQFEYGFASEDFTGAVTRRILNLSRYIYTCRYYTLEHMCLG